MKISDEIKVLNEQVTEWLLMRSLRFEHSNGRHGFEPPVDPEDKPWEHIEYQVRIERLDRGFPVQLMMESAYRKGMAHVTDGIKPYRWAGGIEYRVPPRPIPPMVAEVLGSWIRDASYSSGHTFEDFCWEFGYSDDSIRAMEVYRACQKIENGLNKTFSFADREALSAMLEDYY